MNIDGKLEKNENYGRLIVTSNHRVYGHLCHVYKD